MRISICRPCELNASEVERWRSFQRHTSTLASPFLTPEFAAVMSERRADIKLAVMEDGGSIVGYFAFERNRLGVGRALCYGFSDNQAVVHAPEFEWNGDDLLEACGLAVWEFDHLVIDQVQRFAPQALAFTASPIVDLTGGWESWHARKKSTKRIKKIREHERKLLRELGAPRFETDDRDSSRLELLMQWKSAQYRRTGRFDRFARDWFADGMRRLFATRTDSFSVQLSTMLVRERPVSFHLSLRANGMLAGWFPAYDVKLASYGVGVIHQLYLLMQASDSGIRIFDCGAGDESYKKTFSDSSVTLAKGSLSRRSAVALARRIQTAPKRMAIEFVLSRPPLRKAARKALNLLGGMRSLIHSG